MRMSIVLYVHITKDTFHWSLFSDRCRACYSINFKGNIFPVYRWSFSLSDLGSHSPSGYTFALFLFNVSDVNTIWFSETFKLVSVIKVAFAQTHGLSCNSLFTIYSWHVLCSHVWVGRTLVLRATRAWKSSRPGWVSCIWQTRQAKECKFNKFVFKRWFIGLQCAPFYARDSADKWITQASTKLCNEVTYWL